MALTYSSYLLSDGSIADNYYFLRSDGTLVLPTDTGLASWLQSGNKIGAPSPIAWLSGAAQRLRETIASGGITVNVGTSTAPQNVKCSTDTASLILLQGAYSTAQANANATFTWVGSDGTSQTLTSAQVITIFNAVTQFLQSTFTSLSKVISAIQAGTITTMAQVQNPPSTVTTWPVNR